MILRVIFLFAKSPKNWVLADNFGHTTPEKMVDASKLGCVSTRNFGSHINKKAAVVITILRIDGFFFCELSMSSESPYLMKYFHSWLPNKRIRVMKVCLVMW